MGHLMHKHSSTIKKFIGSIIVLAGIAGLVSVSFYWSQYNQYFTEINTNFSGNIAIAPSEFQSVIRETTADDILLANISIISKNIEKHPYVAGARVSKHFPDQITIEIVEREPIALINRQPILLVDKTNTILPVRTNSLDLQLPILSNISKSPNDLAIDVKSSSNVMGDVVQFLNRLIKEYPGLYQNLSEIRLSNSADFELILAEQPTKIVLGKSMEWSKMLILKEFENSFDGRKSLIDFAYLDLRYDNQVIIKERRA